MVVFDSTTLSLLFLPNAAVPTGRDNKPIKHVKERLEALIDQIAQAGESIIIPTPALSEFLVKSVEKTDEFLKTVRASPWFRIEAFDIAAAVEVGQRTAQAIAAGDKREGSRADWTKIKYDRQIVAIALVAGASRIISDDRDVQVIGARWGVQVLSVEDLPIPPELTPPLLRDIEQEDESDNNAVKGNAAPLKKN